VENEKEPEVEGGLCSERLNGLMTGIDKSVTREQANGLSALLNRYPDVFSKNELDLGVTPLAKHRIDTGETRPIRY